MAFFKIDVDKYQKVKELQDNDCLVLYIYICKLANYHSAAYLGNIKAIGLTYARYRKAKKKLEDLEVIELFPSKKGTIALLK